MTTTNQTAPFMGALPGSDPASLSPSTRIPNNSSGLFLCIGSIAFILLFLCTVFGASAQANLEAVTFGSGEFLAIASNGEVVSSTDGINWESVSAPSGNWQDIIYGNNLYVAVGYNAAMTSTDGENWVTATVPSGGWSAVVYNNGLYVASAAFGSNYVMTSPDGITWTQRTPAYPWPHNDLAFGQISGVDRFVAVCQLGRGWIASDPTGTWYQINPGTIVDIRAITFGNGKFVWLQWGGSGTVYAGVSTNGTNFTPSPSGVLNNWNSLVYGNNTYVAVASGGSNPRAAYSADGASWSYGSGVEDNSWQSVAFGNDIFVAVSNSGTNRIMYSTDGITWEHDVNLQSANTDPVISTVDDLTTCPDSATSEIPVTLSDTESTSADLLLSAVSDNATLLPDVNIELTGNTATRKMVLHPVTGQTGTADILLTVTDEEGATAETAFTVTFEDLTAPTAVTRDITVALDADGQAAITPAMVDDGSYDNCGIESLSLDVTDFDCTSAAQTPVTLTVTDNFGNSATSVAMVTMVDALAPVALTKDITVELDADGQAAITPAMVDDGSYDNCKIESLSLDVTEFDCTSAAQTPVTLTVTDNFGNSATSVAMVTVGDLVAPTVITKDITMQLDVDGQAVITPEMVDNGTYDNCGLQTIALDIEAFTCSDAGIRTVNLTATDVRGNSSVAVAMVTVEDPNPDQDKDGISDVCDPDDDNDGTPDTEDAFPLDPSQSSEADGNGNGEGQDDDRDTDQQEDIPVEAPPSLIPAEAFTPNGDGMNDTWMIPGITNYPNNMVKIYNRWGHEVFSVKGYKNDWSGFNRANREKLPAGSYLYVLNPGNGSAPVQGWLFINY